MNSKLITKFFASIVTLATACVLALGGLLLAPPAARADEGTPTPGPFADGTRLEYLCREQGRALEGQQDRLNVANDLADKTET
ncbi:MAG: hypothetical protein FJ030_18965 [Chloroflexi bacterium]|nr:hypothetical protein [Chloroflexota bacterium]